MDANKIDGSKINYPNETESVSQLSTLKHDLSDIFTIAIGDNKIKEGGNLDICINSVMEGDSIESIINEINAYLRVKANDSFLWWRMSGKYKRFIDELESATKNNKLNICDNYVLSKGTNDKYQFIIKENMPQEAVLSTESCSNAASVDHEKINSARESIRCAENKLMKLIHLYSLARGLYLMQHKIFESNIYRGKDLTINKDVIFKGSMSGEHDLDKLQLRYKEIEKLIESYDKEIIMNMGSLPELNNSLVIVCKTSPNALALINSLLLELSNKHDTLWTRFVNAIASVLFPDLPQDYKNVNMQSAKDLLELKGLITELRKYAGYDQVAQANWLYGLVTQIFVKGTPAQYPFDPLNILSPDRKVWLALQKEWPVLIKPKSTEPEAAQ